MHRIVTALLATCLIAGITAAQRQNAPPRAYGGQPNPAFKMIVTPQKNSDIDDIASYGINVIEIASAYPGNQPDDRAARLLGYADYARSKGLWVSAKRPADVKSTGNVARLMEMSVCRDPKGQKLPPCTASDELRSVLAEAASRTFDYLHCGHMRLFDEYRSWVCDYHLHKAFPAHLARKGYKPSDFNPSWKSWESIVNPGLLSDAAASAPGMGKLSYELRLWKQENVLKLIKAACDAVTARHPKANVNAGIFSPLSLYAGYDTSIPLTRMHEIATCPYMEIDFYDNTLTGGMLAPKDLWVIKAANEMATDLSGMPLMVTLNLRMRNRTNPFLRLHSLMTPILTDNVMGINYYYWKVPVEDAGGKPGPVIEKGHPRMDAIASAITGIKKVYPAIKQFHKQSRILMVVEDLIHVGRGVSPEETNQFGKFDYTKMRRMPALVRPYDMVCGIHRNARFAVPGTLDRYDLGAFDVMLVNATHCSGEQFDKIVRWARSGRNVLLMYEPDALMLDDYGEDKTARRQPILAALRNARPAPRELPAFQKAIESHLKVKDFTPGALYDEVDIDVKSDSRGNRAFILTNYGIQPRSVAFTLEHEWARNEQLMNSAKLTIEKRGSSTHVAATLPPQEMEIVVFRK